MSDIQIKRIGLKNFKGLKDQTIDFNRTTHIFGDNGTGKTTIFDAFTWLLFGKDSTDRKDFNIKTLDSNNKVIEKIEHEVSAILDINGEELHIKRILKENWVKKRGAMDSEFSGNITDYYWNDVPKTQKEFQDKIATVLDELVFKLITNPIAFNSMKWQDRRQILTQIVPEISDVEALDSIANLSNKQEVANLTNQLNSGKTLDDYKKQIASQRKKINDDLKNIPTRIDEVSRNTPEALDFDRLRLDKKSLEQSLLSIDTQIEDRSKAFDARIEERNSISRQMHDKSLELENIERDIRNSIMNTNKPDNSELVGRKSDLSKKQLELSSSENGLKTLVSKRQYIVDQIKTLSSEIDRVRESWGKANAEELNFDNEHFDCPTCKRVFDQDTIETKKSEMEANFIANKQRRLTEISTQGKGLAKQKESLLAEQVTLDERIEKGNEITKEIMLEVENLKSTIEHLESKPQEAPVSIESQVQKELSTNTVYQDGLKLVESLRSKLTEEVKVDIEDLKAKKLEYNNLISAINANLQVEQQIITSNKRVEDLKVEESKLSQEVNDLEKTQFLIDNFIKVKVGTLESRINERFSFVKFKMFDIQINGGEVECCDVLIDGVPFSDANTASKINAGLDIINTLCDHYKVTAPIFIDNRESVVEIVECRSQIINLVVSESDKKLRVA